MAAEALELQYRILTFKLQEAIINDRNEVFYSVLQDLPPHSKRRISLQKIQGRSSFFQAVQLGRHDFTAFLIQDCDVDIDQLSTFEYSGGEHEVTPLWIAAYNDDLNMVKLLVENGANVNAASEGESTPALVACQTDAIDIVKYLSENGANLNIADDNGMTCLRESLDNEDLCRYILSRNVDLSFHHPRQYPIIHCAINLKQPTVVQLLLQHDGNVRDLDFDGNDALTFAAIQCLPEIVECIISNANYDKKDVIDGYELLGASLIDKNRVDEGLEYWRKAMKMRFEDADNRILKKEVEHTLVFGDIEEPLTMEDIDSLGTAPDDLRIQSLLVRERVLGPNHPDTLYKVLTYGMILSYDKDYDGALTVLGYTFEIFMKKNNPLHDMVIYSMSQRVRLLSETVGESVVEGLQCPAGDILKAFEQIVEMIRLCYEHRTQDETFLIRQKKAYNSVLTMTLELLYLICHLKLEYDDDQLLSKLLNKINQISPRNLFKQTLLHISYVTEAKDTRAVKLPGRQNWHPYLTEVLLQHGSDVDVRDVFRNTPLLTYLKNNTISTTGQRVVSALLRHGAHVDCYNVHGDSAISLMREQGYYLCEVKYTTLKCLAARVVVGNSIYVPGYVPSEVFDFVNLHENVKGKAQESQANDVTTAS